MKRIWVLLMIPVILMCAMVGNAVTEYGIAEVTADPTVNLGESIAFTVSIRDAQPVQAVMLEPVYDTQVFELVSGAMQQSGLMSDFNGADGVIAWAEPTQPSGAIMTFTLRPKSGVKPDSSFIVGCKYTVRDSQGQLRSGISIGSEVTVVCDHSYEDGYCTVCGKSEFAARVGQTGYATIQEAVKQANGAYVTLLEDSEESVLCEGDLYLDLNGFSLQELTVGGFLYGVDSTTADYDCADGYGVIQQFGGTYISVHSTADMQRYVAVEQKEGLSFHRVYVGVTHMSLRGSSMEFGFKVGVYGDQVIKSHLTSYGFHLWTTEDRKLGRDFTAEDFNTGKTGNVMSARVRNILSTVLTTDESNAKALITDITADCYLSLNLNGRVLTITSQPVSSNLKNMLTVTNAMLDRYTASQIATLQKLIETYRVPLEMAGCKVDNIVNWTE